MATEATKETKHQRLDRAFNPRVVAVVGAKKAADYSWLRFMKEFQGKLYSVQVDPNEIPGIQELGVHNVASLLDIPEPVDYVVCAVPRAIAPRIVQDCIRKEVAGVTLYTSGFAETQTEEGIRLQQVIAQMAQEADLVLVGPNCMGLYNPQIGLKFSQEQPAGVSGPVAFISQSGTQAIGFTLGAHASGIGISKAASMGNGVVLDIPDYLEYFAQDPQTQIIGIYAEGIRDGRRFFRVLREVAQHKSVVIWKGGQTQESSRAANSHSSSLAVPEAIWDAVLRQCGAIKTIGMEDTLDVVKALLFTKAMVGERLGLIAVSGGHSVEIADAFAREGFQIPRLSEESYQQLSSFYSVVGGSYRNPLEGGGNWASEDNVLTVLDILERDANVDAIVMEMSAGGGFRRDPEALEQRIQTLHQWRTIGKKPLWVVHGGGFLRTDPATMQSTDLRLQEGGIPGFPTFVRAARALRNLVEYTRNRNDLS